jgi:hypothetical protein
LLGWDEIDVWVNHELAEQGELAVEQRLIEDNLVGRNLHRLDQVRCYRRLGELAQQTPEQRLRSHQRGRLRDVIGARLGMSGRTLERYLRVLEAPKEVQDAFRAGQISLVNASKVPGLPREVQDLLADDIRSGIDANQAVTARLAGRAPDQFHAGLARFIRSLGRNVAALEGQVSQVRSLADADIDVLERAQELIGQILRQVRKEDRQNRKRRKA